MTEEFAHWHTSRKIVKRVVVTGELVLLTPTHLGNGDSDGPTDMSLLRDPLTGTQALLTGASIAGALRNHLWELERGYGYDLGDQGLNSIVTLLFGGERADPSGSQSLLVVDDARSQKLSVEIRDGVRIDADWGTAAQGAKFDLELLQAGLTFPLRFELLIPEAADALALQSALARALQGFELEEIGLGGRKRRGFGRCKVMRWHVISYDLTTLPDLLAWISEEETVYQEGPNIGLLLGISEKEQDARQRFCIEADLRLQGSLLVRSEADGVDAGHLHSYRPDGEERPILPGTSLAGVLRHRALRIANTLSSGEGGAALVDDLFGHGPDSNTGQRTASRMIVHESVVDNVRSLAQTRVRIDRFTGGAYETGLFTEAPVYGGDTSHVRVSLQLRNPEPHEIGLLLLLLKDLWLGDLPVGGERSVGRGRLQGTHATLQWQQGDTTSIWTIASETGDGLRITGTAPTEQLETCVQKLQTHLVPEGNDEHHT